MTKQILLALSVLLLALPTGARAADFDASFERGLTLRVPSLASSLRLGGRLHLDAVYFDDDVTEIDNELDVRRARLYLDGRTGDDWRAKVEYEFANVLEPGFRNVWIAYDGLRRTTLRGGNFTMPFGLEETGSSNYAIFAERSLASALAPSFGTGIGVVTRGKLLHRSRWLLSAGGFVESFARDDLDRHRADHASAVGRAVFAPYVRRRWVVHFGGSVRYSDVQGDHTWRESTRPGSAFSPRLLNVTLSNIGSVTSLGAEGALMLGPVLLQGEYLQSDLERRSSSTLRDPRFTGAYLQASFVVTGESHRYSRSTATFGGVEPRSKWGAVEIAARWDTLDLTDAGVSGGKATDWTVGVNWYVRKNLRVMANYVHVQSELTGSLQDDDPRIFLVRFMYFL